MESKKLTRRDFLNLIAMTGSSAVLAACGGAPTATAPETSAPTLPTEESNASTPSGGTPPMVQSGSAEDIFASGETISLEQLIEGAQQEGTLNVMALPRDWANYGEVIDTFKQKYGLEVNEIKPDASSAEELEAIRANRENKGAQAPDVVDVGLGFTETGVQEELFAKYKVATWDTIPENLKHSEGYWMGDYYGVMAFQINADLVETLPEDWADLLTSDYKGQIALAGDPTQSAQAVNAVWAAALANGGSLDDAMPGIEFFADLNKAGNFVPVVASTSTLAQGETPIVIRWDYLALTDRDTLGGNPPVEVVVPKTGILAGVYAQAVSAYAPHPYAARLWLEFLYSDEGQLLWLKGYTHPIRYDDLVKRKKIPEELASKLPPANLYAQAAFPTLEQTEAAKTIITENWRSKVVGG